MSNRQHKDKAEKWKAKAVCYRKENERLNKCLNELRKSRDGWKSKCKELKQSSNATLSGGSKAKGHHYSLSTVNFLVELYKYGNMSLRSCCYVLTCLNRSLGLDEKIPGHTSLRNWLCKCGLKRLEEASNEIGNYVVWADESISFGSEKILLILGIRESRIPKDRSLNHSDVEVLYTGVSKEWKGEQIAKELAKIAVNKSIKYVVSDEGNNLKKAYKLLEIKHIEDCTHILANHLKKLYAKDKGFLGFSKLIGKLRKKWNLSKDNSEYMPPMMRGKMRFANIFPCVNWAKKMLDKMENLPVEVQKEVTFLKEEQELITSLVQAESIFKTVCESLKNQGFGLIQQRSILDKLSAIEAQTPKGLAPRAIKLMENTKGYLGNLAMKSKEIAEDFLLCSSDIIEGYFGKFKAKINSNSRSGLTEFIFTIATFGKHFSVDETKKALENIKCKQLKLEKIPARTA
jgi:hypothetical protein